MEDPKRGSGVDSLVSEASDAATPARRAWSAPELVKVDVADSTRGGNVVQPTESVWYKTS
jgi:hypothetical protein